MAARSLSATIAASESTPGTEKLSVCAASRSGSPLRTMPRGLSAARAAVLDRSAVPCPLRVLAEGEFRGQAEACDQRDWQCAGAEPAFLAAAEHQRAEREALVAAPPRYQGADAFRGVDLVAGDAQQIDPAMTQGLDLLAESLGGVDVEIRLVPGKDVGDLRDRLDDAGLVVGGHD